MKAEDITKPALKKVAKELNEQLGLEPPILLDIKTDALQEKCIEAAALIDPQQDEFSEQVWEILGALGCDPRTNVTEEASQPAEVVEDEGEATKLVGEAMEETLVVDFKAAKKLKDMKALADEWECFANLDLDTYTGLGGVKQLREDMLACMPAKLRKLIEPKSAAKTEAGSEKARDPEQKKAAGGKKTPKSEWDPGKSLKAANAGTKVAKALDYIAEQKLVGIKLSDLADACNWREDLAKAYLTQNIVQLGYGVKIHENETFDLLLPAEEKTIKAHNKK